MTIENVVEKIYSIISSSSSDTHIQKFYNVTKVLVEYLEGIKTIENCDVIETHINLIEGNFIEAVRQLKEIEAVKQQKLKKEGAL